MSSIKAQKMVLVLETLKMQLHAAAAASDETKIMSAFKSVSF